MVMAGRETVGAEGGGGVRLSPLGWRGEALVVTLNNMLLAAPFPLLLLVRHSLIPLHTPTSLV